jgi:hypothetical protein
MKALESWSGIDFAEIGEVMERSRQVREQYQRLLKECLRIRKDLMIATLPRCPVCGSRGAQTILQTNLLPDSNGGVLAYRCAGGHMWQAPSKPA